MKQLKFFKKILDDDYEHEKMIDNIGSRLDQYQLHYLMPGSNQSIELVSIFQLQISDKQKQKIKIRFSNIFALNICQE